MVGFDAGKGVLNQQYLCKICSLILREPVQLNCGHRQCKSCVESKIEGEIIRCPECQEETPQKEVLLDRGFKNDMKTLIVQCSLCDWKSVLKDYEDHLEQSHPNPSCEYCGKNFDSINSLNLHKLSECDKITVPCALKDYGCSSAVRRVAMLEHYRSKQHQTATIAFLCRDLSKITSNQHERGSGMDIDTFPHTTTSLSDNINAQLQEVRETNDVLVGGIQALNEDAQRLNTELLRVQNQLDALSKEFTTFKLSLNPGLPANNQQSMIKQEAERRAQQSVGPGDWQSGE